VHRIGRTARVGKDGCAISFACEDFAMNLMDIESYIEKSIPIEPITSDLLVDPAPRKKMRDSLPRANQGPRKRSSRSGNRRHDDANKGRRRRPKGGRGNPNSRNTASNSG
jgi:ATP-dependent RNA helicase RhlB